MRFSNNLELSLNRFDMRADLFESTAYTMAVKYVFLIVMMRIVSTDLGDSSIFYPD